MKENSKNHGLNGLQDNTNIQNHGLKRLKDYTEKKSIKKSVKSVQSEKSVMQTINWPTKKLGEVCDFLNGLWTGKEPPYIKVGVIRNTNFTKEGKLDDSDIAYLKVEKDKFEKRKLAYGDIILEKSGGGPKQPVGRVVIFDKQDGNFSFSNFTSVIRIKNPSKLDFNFLYKFLFFSYISGITESMQRRSTGIRNLQLKEYKQIQIPLPPLPEQRRIVKILDEVFEKTAKAKENAEKNLQNSKELFESYLQSVFSNEKLKVKNEKWEKKRLVDVFQIKPPKKEAKEKLKNNGLVSFVPMEYLQKMSKEFTCNKERKLKDVSGSYTYFANEDVLLAKITPCFENGKLGIARNLKNGIGFGSSEYIVFRSNGEVVPDYLYYFLARNQFREEGAKRMSGAVGHKRVSKEFIENTEMPFPLLPQQHNIVAKLDKLSAETKKLEAIYRQKLADLEELKKSVLKSAFAGKL